MTRRQLLSTASLFVVAACTNTGAPTPGLQTAITDAGLVVNGAASVEQQFVLLYPKALNPGQLAAVQTGLAAAQTAMTGLTTAANTPATGTQLLVIETNVNAVIGILGDAAATIPGVPPEVNAGILAARVLLPIIEATANQAISGAATPPAVKAISPNMGPDHARLVLRSRIGR